MHAPVELDAIADPGVRTQQPEGIGRVAVLGDLVCWNNLGRNVVFADRRLRPRAVFADTDFPGDDEAAQYDLDVHAILEDRASGLVLVLNHLGAVRGFDAEELRRPGPLRLIQPVVRLHFAADVERTVISRGRLVGSSPRSSAEGGLLVSPPLDGGRSGTVPVLAGDGEVTAIGTAGSRLLIGGDGAVTVASLGADGKVVVGWRAAVDFRVAAVGARPGLVWAAGPRRGASVGDYDWEMVRGGGWAVLRSAGGGTVASGPMPDGIAWGTGGQPVIAVGRSLAAASRAGSLHVLPRAITGTTEADHGARPGDWRAGPPVTETSMGIGHGAALGGRAVWGFNRGGYRLFSSLVDSR